MGVSQSNNAKLVQGKPTVLVLGGGYAGVEVAKKLDKKGEFQVVLLDRKDHFYHNIGALRTVAVENWHKQVMIPYTKLLKYGTFVQAEVTEIDPTRGVFVAGREEPLVADYVVVCLGSSYNFPTRAGTPMAHKAYPIYAQLRKDVDDSKRVVIVGGGAVGVELAGELADLAKEQKRDLSVTLIHAHDKLVRANLSDKFHTSLNTKLAAAGVKVVLNERVDLSSVGFAADDEKAKTLSASLLYVHKPTQVKTDKGNTFEADLVFHAGGTPANKAPLVPHFASKLTAEGRIRVNDALQIESDRGLLKNYFACGDIANIEDKMAFFARLQANVVASNIRALSKKADATLTNYSKFQFPVAFVTLGKSGGVGQMPNKSATVVGDFLVKNMKGKDFMIGGVQSTLNQKFDAKRGEYDAEATPARKLHHRTSMASVFKMTEEDVVKFERQTSTGDDESQSKTAQV